MEDTVLLDMLVGLYRIRVIYYYRLCECNSAGVLALCERTYERTPFDRIFRISAGSRAMSLVFRGAFLYNVDKRCLLCGVHCYMGARSVVWNMSGRCVNGCYSERSAPLVDVHGLF